MPYSTVFAPRDIVFIGRDGTINQIIESASAETLNEVVSKDTAKALLQLNGGATKAYNIKAGNTVNYE